MKKAHKDMERILMTANGLFQPREHGGRNFLSPSPEKPTWSKRTVLSIVQELRKFIPEMLEVLL